MHRFWPLLGALALGACHKEPPRAPPGRPKDVCSWAVTVKLDCTVAPPDGTRSDPAGNCYDVGNQLFHCGLFGDAAKWLQKSAELRPDPHTFHALGDAYFLNEQWQQAHDAYRRAVDLDPQKRESWVRLAQTYLRLGSPKDAHAAVARAMAIDPGKPDALRAEADAFSAEGQFDQAIDALHRAEKLGNEMNRKNCAEQEVQIAQLKLRKLKRIHAPEAELATAEGQLATALTLQVSVSKPTAGQYRDLSDARLASGDLRGAEAALQQASALDPKDFVSPRLIGLIRQQRGDLAGAREALQASLKIEPKQTMSYVLLGQVDLAEQQPQAAHADFVQALANATGEDPTETRELAALAYQVGERDKALALYKSLDDDPDLSPRVDFWLDQARVAQALGQADEVQAACKKAHALVESATCPPAADPKK